MAHGTDVVTDWDIIFQVGDIFYNVDYFGDTIRIARNRTELICKFYTYIGYHEGQPLYFSQYEIIQGDPKQVRDAIEKDPVTWLMEQML